MPMFRKAVGRLKLWSSMSEGAEVIRHARACNDFVEARPPAGKRQQLFHGLGGEISRGYYYHNLKTPALLDSRDYTIGRQILLDAADPRVPLNGEARDRLEARWEAFSQDLGTDRFTVAQWLDLFFWQNSCLRWGADMLSVKNPMYWIWTPFLDRQLITGFLQLEPGDKRSDRFVEDLAARLAGELKGLEYDVPSRQRSIESRLLRSADSNRRSEGAGQAETATATRSGSGKTSC